MLALFRPLCWCFMPWLYSGLYTEGLYHGFILGFILGFMSLGRGVSVASVASGAVLATAGAHRGATPQLGNSGSIRKLYCHRNSILGVVQGGRSRQAPLRAALPPGWQGGGLSRQLSCKQPGLYAVQAGCLWRQETSWPEGRARLASWILWLRATRLLYSPLFCLILSFIQLYS